MEIWTSTQSRDLCLEVTAGKVKNYPVNEGSSAILLCWFVANIISLHKQKSVGLLCIHLFSLCDALKT